MHILHIYKDYYPVVGGIEGHVQTLAEGLVEAGHRVTVLVTNTGPRTSIGEEGGVTVIRAGRDVHVASTPMSLEMPLLARQVRPDIVHLHMPYPPGDVIVQSALSQTPLVVTYHSDIVRQKRLLQLYRPVLDRTLKRAKQIIVTSAPYIASSPYLRRYEAKCQVIPYGIDVQIFGTYDTQSVERLRLRFGRPTILAVGVLRYYKGLHFLIEAMQNVPAGLVIVGSGPEQEELQALVTRHQLGHKVFFEGRKANQDLGAYYHASDVFVLPSHLRSEAFGIVLLEAMAAGLPLITTELGTGTSFVNQHGHTGFVIAPAESMSLARALRVLIENPALRARFGQSGRQSVQQNYTTTIMLQRTIQVYSNVLAMR
ncbi:MAG: glycosyltransferase [Herpetosiphon sp.]